MTPSADGIAWHPVCLIDKYSAEQVAWARQHYKGPPTGDLLRLAFPVPEGGTVSDQGNGVVLSGTANLALVLTGSGGHPLAPGRAAFGVGCDATAFSREHVHLANDGGEEPGRSWYRPMDFGYPRVTRTGVIEGQATFSESEACFDWHEWTWASGPVPPTAHHSLRGAYRGGESVMMNRRSHQAGYGEKLPGVAWVFRTEITIGG